MTSQATYPSSGLPEALFVLSFFFQIKSPCRFPERIDKLAEQGCGSAENNMKEENNIKLLQGTGGFMSRLCGRGVAGWQGMDWVLDRDGMEFCWNVNMYDMI